MKFWVEVFWVLPIVASVALFTYLVMQQSWPLVAVLFGLHPCIAVLVIWDMAAVFRLIEKRSN